ncbi:N-acetylglucosaminyl transferase [Parvularcula bermudensis HTCC2503]|uniref:UDP-N-acetylglucosamine--N-acetylmuramyl-(pentapeptide) pyrophosphoryl-undecaprenol N-acetylglucosamine transferase n=1 Tax=Parvularcula bermudensis (strain ATCC BAA-594 / HTCC2503 / KCTC 12087) TaxID=314260 RepID=E0TDT1_PARBH|nr:UDP-N-acetylglucosamine--N-acetylmuramyl-(pentapeptide) pyrophosphoryl-undecaprenol N-acetylglucosamine transferase [Parvularcula bermudensis]ADM09997.1 N-acetylglucosaminyl transferase [Parvularcula bermudensis HTCC2503]
MTATIGFAAGGTGGHMFPAQAVAHALKARGHRIILFSDARGMRYADDFPADRIVLLEAANPNAKGLWAKATAAFTLLSGLRTARRALKEEAVDLMIGFGGYPSAPGYFAARTLRLPTVLHEANAILGRVNRRAAPGADLVAHGFPSLARLPDTSAAIVFTGNPVREAVRAAAALPWPSTASDAPLKLLIFGGSQGAALFGRVFPAAISQLPAEIRYRLVVTHQVTDDHREAVAAAYEAAGVEAVLAPFFPDLPARIADSHLVVARAGAGTVTELSLIARPAILVPLAIAMDDHQRLNAESLAKSGAADILLEAEATPEAAAALLLPRLRDPQRSLELAAAAGQGVPPEAAADLAERIEMLLEG